MQPKGVVAKHYQIKANGCGPGPRLSPLVRGNTSEPKVCQFYALNSAACGMVLTKLLKQNVLVNAAGCACLSDIGFTTFVRDEELGVGDAGNIAHTSQWTAPEVFKNGKFSKQSDVFSFGFVAAEVRSQRASSPIPPINHA